MTIAIGQHVKGNVSSAGSGTTASRTTQATGSTFYIAINDANGNVTVSDSKGNTYAQAGTDQAAGVVTSQLWYCENGVGGAGHTWTVTANSGTLDCAFYAGEITGATAALFDTTAQAADAASPYTVTSPTLAQANELVLVVVGTDGNPDAWAEGTGFTIHDDETDDGLYWTSCIAHKIVSATTAVTASFTATNALGSGCALVLATFKESGGTPGSASGAGVTDNVSAPTATAAPITATITHRLISKTGAAQASVSGITALIYKQVPSTAVAPDKVVTGVSTNGSGNLNINVSDIALSIGDPVWLILMKDGSPPLAGALKVTPVYS